ncbi:MAG: class I SAM-dependent methyltransferase [Myxococcales bacterium]|nr:class I SAM-dependent methyltransferase [Myxococcales bacterium]
MITPRASELDREEVLGSPARRLGPSDAAIYDTFVAPTYMSMFVDLFVEMLASGRDARICHVGCRTGYPASELLERLPNAHIFGCDPSEPAVRLARARAATVPGLVTDYRHVEDYPLPFPEGAFSHAFTIHPLAAPAERRRLLQELVRIVAPRGQALIALPMRGSFLEIADLLRELALKSESTELTNAVEAAVQLRPTEETLSRELADVGFDFIAVQTRTRTLRYESARELFDDPTFRVLLLPEFAINLGLANLEAPFQYVREAIDKYWSGTTFELTVNVGCASGRRR